MIAVTDLIVSTGRKTAQSVATLEDAVRVCAQIRDRDFGIGATEYYGKRIGLVYQGTTKIAQVHYNGRIEMTGENNG